MKRLVASLLLFQFASTTAWAARVPTAIEFRAAYCFRIMQWSVRERSSNQSMLEQELRARRHGSLPVQNAGLSDETLQEMLQRTQAEAVKEQASLGKLQQYLEPRIPVLEPEALRAASQKANADIQDIADLNGKCGFKCAHGPDFEACLAEKCDASNLLQRFSGCRDPSWLAF